MPSPTAHSFKVSFQFFIKWETLQVAPSSFVAMTFWTESVIDELEPRNSVFLELALKLVPSATFDFHYTS